MSDLVKRLRYEQEGAEFSNRYADLVGEAADLIEQLERELAIAEKMAADANEAYSQAHVSMIEALDQLAAEKALAEDIFEAWRVGVEFNPNITLAAYRKARGL